MTDKGADSQDRRLWQRWQALGEKSRVSEPDAMLLAAYAADVGRGEANIEVQSGRPLGGVQIRLVAAACERVLSQ